MPRNGKVLMGPSAAAVRPLTVILSKIRSASNPQICVPVTTQRVVNTQTAPAATRAPVGRASGENHCATQYLTEADGTEL